MPDDSRIDIQFGANAEPLVSGAKQAATAVDAAAKAMTGGGTAAKGMSTQLQQLLDTISKGKISVEMLDKATDQLGKHLDQGRISAEEFKAKLGELNDSYKKLADDSETAGGKMHGSAGAMREVMVLAHEAATGNFKRFGGSLMVLANQFDAIPPAAKLAGLAIAAVGLIAFEALKHFNEVSEAVDHMRARMVLLGRGNEVSEEQLAGLVKEVREFHSATRLGQSAALDVVKAMEAIPVATEKSRRELALLAPIVERMTEGKESAESLATAMAGGAQALEAWGNKYTLFSSAQRAAMETAARNNDTYKAQEIFLGALTNRVMPAYVEYLEKIKAHEQDAGNYDQMTGIRVGSSEPPPVPKLEGGATAEDEATRQFTKNRETLLGTYREEQDLKRRIAELTEHIKVDTGEQLEEDERALKVAQDQLAALKQSPGQASRLQQWRADLAKIEEADDLSKKEMLSREISFWQNILDTEKLTGSERAQIETEVSRTRKRLADEEKSLEVADIRERLAEERRNGDERIRLADQLVEKVKEKYGQDTKEFKQASAERVRIYQEETDRLRALTAKRIESDQIASTNALAVERENIRFKQALRQGDAAQNLADTMRLLDMEYQQQLTALSREQALYKQGEKQYEDYEKAKQKLTAKYNLEKVKAEHNAQIASVREWTQAFKTMTSGFGSALTGMITGAQTFQQAIANIGQSVLTGFINMLMQMVERWIVEHAIMDMIFGTSQATQQMSAAEANAGIAESHAEVAAVAAAASVAAIPFYGWAMAGPTAAATSAMLQPYVIAAGAMASAAGGWDQIPSDQIAQVHKDEMILPAALAGGIRNIIAAGYAATGAAGGGSAGGNGNSVGGSGGGGGPSTVIIQAMDAHDVRRVFRNNPRAVADGARSAVRNNLSTRVR